MKTRTPITEPKLFGVFFVSALGIFLIFVIKVEKEVTTTSQDSRPNIVFLIADDYL